MVALAVWGPEVGLQGLPPACHPQHYRQASLDPPVSAVVAVAVAAVVVAVVVVAVVAVAVAVAAAVVAVTAEVVGVAEVGVAVAAAMVVVVAELGVGVGPPRTWRLADPWRWPATRTATL